MIKVKKLNKDAKLPFKAHEEDAGYDVFSIEEKIIPAKTRETLGTGIAISLPEIGSQFEELYIRVAPRSGLSVKKGIDVFAGVIDRGYTGEIKVCLFNSSNKEVVIKKGDKIAQLIPTIIFKDKIQEVEDLKSTQRGDGGFGSTGQ